MKISDIERLRRAAELADTRERCKLAKLTCLAEAHRSALRDIGTKLSESEVDSNLSAAEAYRIWCRRRLKAETAALRETEMAQKRQLAIAAKATARQRVLEAMIKEERKTRKKTRLRREIEIS